MADNEERILISGLRKYKGDTYKLTMFGDKDVVPVERVWQMSMTRQEAINKIRIAMHKVFIKQEPAGPLFLNYAEAALNALLEGVKK